ncbi:MAG: hydantoinase B/oxoprolinase family protein [Aestuariivita sp.]|nr:hydantoinase B/oxoprolinase family protein [Aestuariivita sp.]
MEELEILRKQLIWNRLISAVEEQAQTVIRTAFSQSVRECGDLSAGVFNKRGQMVAQAVTGTPGHVNAMAICIEHFINKFPVDHMKPGDIFCTNDPWLSVGHYHDVTVVTPAFYHGQVVGLFANTCHIVDMGGRGLGPDSRQVYEEGINIPIMHLARDGIVNEDLMGILRTNVRNARDMEGDFYAMIACNDEGTRRLISILEEFDLDDIEEVGDYIIQQSHDSIRTAVRNLPDGVYENEMILDGFTDSIHLKACTTIEGDQIIVDYDGTSEASLFGINVVMNFCIAYTVFGVNCIIGHNVPCNAGSINVVDVRAPLGSILNVERPMPVSARHVIGQMLPDLVFGCLTQAAPDKVPAEGAGAMWNPMFRGGPTAVDADIFASSPTITQDFDVITFNTGGTGGRPTLDGMSTTAFPSGVRTPPIEAIEADYPLIVWRKELREGSGGAGRYRGGLGQILEFGCKDGAPFSVAAMFDRTLAAPKGRHGGHNGAIGVVRTDDGQRLKSKGRQTIPYNKRLVLEMPGGGGYGDPRLRDPELVRQDALDELITPQTAQEDYGVVLMQDMRINQSATQEERSK